MELRGCSVYFWITAPFTHQWHLFHHQLGTHLKKKISFNEDARGMLPTNVTLFVLGIKSYDLENAHTFTLREGRMVGITLD